MFLSQINVPTATIYATRKNKVHHSTISVNVPHETNKDFVKATLLPHQSFLMLGKMEDKGVKLEEN